jgi:undecaprenyl-diphosphatase
MRAVSTRSSSLLAVFALAFLGPLIVFLVLAEEVHDREHFGWDTPIIRSVHDLRLPGVHELMQAISFVGGFPGIQLLALGIVLGLLFRRRAADALFVAASVAGAETLAQLLKHVFARPRPVLPYAPPAHTFSFPSGHATDSAALATAVVLLLWPTRRRWHAVAGGALFVIAVGISRVYLGVHFPSDVLAGWCVGISWVAGVRALRGLASTRASAARARASAPTGSPARSTPRRR